jgi:YidC/Oxa1 family membrane protein insertase
MFTVLIVKPIFNLLVLIYALLPGHNFGLSLIIFTVIIRIILWPLLKKQLHQAKAMKKLQPEIKKVKQASKGNKTKESQMLMELYKERGINPFATFPTLILQLVVLIGLYSGLRRVISNPHQLVTFAYPALQHLGWMKELSKNIHLFDETLFGVINLGRAALGKSGVYWPAMVLVLGSAVAQFFQSKQLLPQDKDQRGLKEILKSAGAGKQADQSEINAAVGRSTRYFLPVMIFLFTVNLASALSLYWFTGGIVAYIQQSIVLRDDESEMEDIANKPATKDVSKIPEAEVVEDAKTTKNKKPSSNSKKSKKRRKR